MDSSHHEPSGEFPAIPNGSANLARIPREHAPIELCCLLWARPGQEHALSEYEDQVLAFLSDHGGHVVARAIGPGTDRTPNETQFLQLPTSVALDAYLGDPRRRALDDERARVIARTVLYPIRVTPQAS